MNNERGGLISNILFIPIGVALMAGFFFLGYYIGKYQSKTNRNEVVVPLPDVVSKNLPPKQEFTFFKTLSDTEGKTISIELKPRKENEGSVQKPDQEHHPEKNSASRKEKKAEQKTEKRTVVVSKDPVSQARKEASGTVVSKERYALQLASYQEKQMADEDVKKLKQRGYAAYITPTDIQGKGTWYRVKLGSFSNRPAAEKLQHELKNKEGISSIIMLDE